MFRASAAIIVVFLISCTGKTVSPNAKFFFDASPADRADARRMIYELAIQENMLFSDESHSYPGGPVVVNARAKRIDGLEIGLLGVSETEAIGVFVYCNDPCSEWEYLFETTKAHFAKRWSIREKQDT